ncbi:LOW QUALITY PROTEIN: hypothetical protein U9M48_020684 [Paspalum notatum var. saurae]|uniref:F-box domain-containing protein n=1 Tax=Paspalum notatum var. saurae TaxID=547442 RepID=A0AAQ3TIS1_PASNO
MNSRRICSDSSESQIESKPETTAEMRCRYLRLYLSAAAAVRHLPASRYSIRGAGGGGSLMARIGVRSGIGARRFLLQCRPLAAGGSRGNSRSRADRFLPQRRAEDLISGLSDDLLLLILHRLDTRTALGASLLSRRWAHFPRELSALDLKVGDRRAEDLISGLSDDLLLLILHRLDTRTALGATERALQTLGALGTRVFSALDLKVGDVLPPRYHRWIFLIREIREKGTVLHYGRGAVRLELLPNIRRYERRAMRAFTSSAHSFLDGSRRRVNRLRLEFFITGSAAAAGCMNRLIAEAIDTWGVHDLEAVATPVCWQRDDVHSFPSHGLCKEPRASSRLQSLKLGGCVLPPLHEYSRLTVLVLQDMPKSTPATAYEGVFTSCPQLQTLHLVSCGSTPLPVVVDAPSSEIRELVVERCTFEWLVLRALPRLERLASLRSTVMFKSTSFPCLRKWNITQRHGLIRKQLRRYLEPKLGTLLGRVLPPHVENLIIRFTGPYRWFVPASPPSASLPNLRRLLVADVPSSWDITWPRPLLEMAPSLESLHINIASCQEEPDEEISWPPTELRQHHLMEFVLAGFGGTTRQLSLVRFVIGACTALRHVALFKKGHPLEKGNWDWEMVTQQQSWTDEEKDLEWGSFLNPFEVGRMSNKDTLNQMAWVSQLLLNTMVMVLHTSITVDNHKDQ